MQNSDQIYVDLQKHLDKQAVGFPATSSGIEIQILKELFTPEQAGLALHLNYQPQSAVNIFNQAKGSNVTLEKMEDMLENMESNGAIGSIQKNGSEHYFTIPLLVGIVEMHKYKATPQFWENLGQYMHEGFGEVFVNTKISQLRTIPVEKSIALENQVATYDQIKELIINTDGPIAVGTCMCREKAAQRGQPCHMTTRAETCMGFGWWARHFVKHGLFGFREITREEALKITRQNEEDGLVLQPSNCQKIDVVCACCGCCCGILKIQKSLPKPAENWTHNFYAVVENDNCVGCGTCVKKCQVDAISVDEQKGCATINLNRCIGCGNCVTACPTKAMRLVKKKTEIAPPQDTTELYKILAEK